MVWVAAGLAFVLYSTGFGNPLSIQDRAVVMTNLAVSNFPAGTFTSMQQGEYTPLTWTGYALAFLLGKQQALLFHFLSAAVHAANTALVFRLFKRLDGNTTLAFTVALFFAVHPLQVEAVAWIAAFSTPLFSFFSLLALNAYVRSTEEAAWGKNYGLALGFFVLACLSKPAAVALPLTLLVVDMWLKRPALSRASLIGKAPFFALALAFGMLAFYTHTHAGHEMSTLAAGFSIPDRVLMACHAILLYWIKIIIPFGLSLWYPFAKTAGGGWHWTYYAAPVVLAAIGWLAWRAREAAPFLWRGLLFYLANILFALPFYTIDGFELRSDHYNYLACLGIFASLASLPAYLHVKKPGWVNPYWTVLVGLSIAWLVISFVRIKDWRDTLALIEQSIAKQGDNFGKAYLWHGIAYGDKGEGRKALADFDKAIEINPGLIEAYRYRGGLLGINKEYDQSVDDLNKFLERFPDDPEIRYNRALSLVNLKRMQDALNDLNKAIEVDPNFTRAYRARGNVRKELGDTTGGDADLKEYDRRHALDGGKK